MGFEDGLEKGSSAKGSVKTSKMTLQKAVDLGEYNPEYLATFPEWHELSRHVQFQFIRQGIDNRRKQLVVQYAEVINVLDRRLKPHLKEAEENIMSQLNKLDQDREELYLEYSK
jgi:hypothetical protein